MTPTPNDTPTPEMPMYITHWDQSSDPHWVTRINGGKYVAYHYIQEAADCLTALLNEHAQLERQRDAARADLVELNRHLDQIRLNNLLRAVGWGQGEIDSAQGKPETTP